MGPPPPPPPPLPPPLTELSVKFVQNRASVLPRAVPCEEGSEHVLPEKPKSQKQFPSSMVQTPCSPQWLSSVQGLTWLASPVALTSATSGSGCNVDACCGDRCKQTAPGLCH